MSDQLTLAAGTQNKALSQWFTPPELAQRIVDWAVMPYRKTTSGTLAILEPSAGVGALATRAQKYGHVTCVEIDEENCVRLRAHGLDVICADFLEVWPAVRFDIAIMNPPFEGGQTERHVMRALKHADRVVCHCPLTTLAGKARRESMWSNVLLHRLAICSSRPKYGAEGGKTDMCTIDVSFDHGFAPVNVVASGVQIDWWP